MPGKANPVAVLPINCSSGLFLIAAGLTALAAGGLHRNAALLAAGAVLVIGPTSVYVLLRWSLTGLALTRRAPESAVEGDRVDIVFELLNGSRLPVFFPVIAEVLTFDAEPQANVLFAGRMLPGERLRRGHTGQCLRPRGIYPAGTTRLQVRDPFGWFSLQRPFEFAHSLTVFPPVYPLTLTDVRGRQLDEMCGLRARPAPGWSAEFLKVREYQPGDSPRRIHWGLTARLGRPVLREFAGAAGGDVRLILDLHADAVVGAGRNTSLEHAVRIAASLAAHAVEERRRVHLIAGGDRDAHVPLGRGPAQLRRILNALVLVRPSRREPPFPELLQSLASDVHGGGALVVMVSEYLFGNAQLEACFSTWRQRGRRVVPVLFYESEFPHVRAPQDAEDADGAVHAWRRRLREVGIAAFTAPCGTDFDPTQGGTRL